ncbi:hypothetical protein CSUB01_10297 [Colletotrichum sublineola]|uniref:Uncharacterized protein n=1 Tax=Colletotrichum sublineola TaxID=1173701 RepID=A0A066XL87_COLSU|nr:hypothetical protein CSUB01_10297 [Colletotrichum sublineola]
MEGFRKGNIVPRRFCRGHSWLTQLGARPSVKVDRRLIFYFLVTLPPGLILLQLDNVPIAAFSQVSRRASSPCAPCDSPRTVPRMPAIQALAHGPAAHVVWGHVGRRPPVRSVFAGAALEQSRGEGLCVASSAVRRLRRR